MQRFVMPQELNPHLMPISRGHINYFLKYSFITNTSYETKALSCTLHTGRINILLSITGFVHNCSKLVHSLVKPSTSNRYSSESRYFLLQRDKQASTSLLPIHFLSLSTLHLTIYRVAHKIQYL